MAEVIGHKKINKRQYKATCDNCGAIVVFDDDEIKDNYQYNEYCFSTGKCPECENSISFNKYRAVYRVKIG